MSMSDFLDTEKCKTARKRGRKPTIPLLLQISLFKKNIDKFVGNGQLAKSSSAIYEQIAKKYDVDRQSVYLNAKRYFAKRNIFPPKSSRGDQCDVFEKFGDRDQFFSIDVRAKLTYSGNSNKNQNIRKV